MSIRKTQALVLRSIRYGETSKIVTMLTPDSGKLSVLARGARKVKSRFGGSLEPFTHIALVYYEKETRDLQYVSEVHVIDAFLKVRDNIEKTYTALALIEMCQKAVHDREECRRLFDLFLVTLSGLAEADKNIQNGLVFFILSLTDHLGYRLEVEAALRRRT